MPILGGSRRNSKNRINIIGAGSLGSFTAFELAKMSRVLNCDIRVFDFDLVEERNVGNQIYSSDDLGLLKVTALKKKIKDSLGVDIETEAGAINKFSAKNLEGVVIVLVDNMKSRAEIFEGISYDISVPYFIDARTGENLALVYAFNPRDYDWVERYKKTLYSDEEAANIACAIEETVPTLWSVASVIAQILVRLKKQRCFFNEFIEITVNNQNAPIVSSQVYQEL